MRIAKLMTMAALFALLAAPANAAEEPVAIDIRMLLAQAAQPGGNAPDNAQPPAAAAQEPAAEPPAPRRPRPPAPPRRDPRVDASECSWVGKRTIRVLMRDDLIAAEGFLKFYNAFGCPVRFLGQAFGCSLIGADGAPAKDVESRIDICWNNPADRPTAIIQPLPQPGTARPAPTPAPAARPMPKAAQPPAASTPQQPDTAYPPNR